MTPCTVIQTSPYPVYQIDLQYLKSAVQISSIVKEFGTELYVYTFTFGDHVIKHGISADRRSIPGERIYRQAGHLEGWRYKLAEGSAGTDMREINQRYLDRYGSSLNRNGMQITVYDLTDVQSPSAADACFHVKQLERKLIKDYVDRYNQLPIGNIKDESYIDRRLSVSTQTWQSLFSTD
jgi:hypothetical protein